MQSKKITLTFSVVFSIGMSGCANTGLSLSTYNQKIHDIRIGMTKQEIYDIFPKAAPRSAKQYEEGVVEVLEVNVSVYSFIPTNSEYRNGWTGMEGRPRWFYLFQNRLIQYGKPHDWPAKPDSIIEFRER